MGAPIYESGLRSRIKKNDLFQRYACTMLGDTRISVTFPIFDIWEPELQTAPAASVLCNFERSPFPYLALKCAARPTVDVLLIRGCLHFAILRRYECTSHTYHSLNFQMEDRYREILPSLAISFPFSTRFFFYFFPFPPSRSLLCKS